MPIIFEGEPGRVVQLDDPGIAAAFSLVSVQPELSFLQQRSIITRITIAQQANFQLVHTLGSDIYIFSFGDRAGGLSLTGLCFSDCDSGSNGIEDILRYYDNNRLANLQDQIEVLVGSTSIRGFLVGMTAEVVRPDDQLFSYTLNLTTLPNRI